jgi:hypothetical protein
VGCGGHWQSRRLVVGLGAVSPYVISEFIQFDCFLFGLRKLFLTNLGTETTKLKGWRWNFFSISSRGWCKTRLQRNGLRHHVKNLSWKDGDGTFLVYPPRGGAKLEYKEMV